jgi:hypothetical protein
MSRFDAYRGSFANAGLIRSKTGVLEVALHTDGGTVVFNGYIHEQFVDLFHAIASDPDNRVVILTGSGAALTESISSEGFDFLTHKVTTRFIARAKSSHEHPRHPFFLQDTRLAKVSKCAWLKFQNARVEAIRTVTSIKWGSHGGT